ncbi:MAG: hypothetical protein ACXVRV_08530, partial [Gaiellaceae bacterium]
LPEGELPRKATVSTGGEKRRVIVRGARKLRLSIPTTGAPLQLSVDVKGSPLGGRILGAQVLSLRFVRA